EKTRAALDAAYQLGHTRTFLREYRGDDVGEDGRVAAAVPPVCFIEGPSIRLDTKKRMVEVLTAALADLVAEVRPDLHRYATRMTGSVADGEDVVQETLARAYYDLAELKELPAMRAWLFRIAHNRALDHLRRYDRRMGEPLDDTFDIVDDAVLNPEDALAQDQAVRAAVSRFLELVPAQRSCVILKDVLDYSLDEIAALLELSEPAVKAALHRGRERLRELSEASRPTTPMRPVSPALARYAALFNARDWDGVRSMLAEDVRLDLVSRMQRAG